MIYFEGFLRKVFQTVLAFFLVGLQKTFVLTNSCFLKRRRFPNYATYATCFADVTLQEMLFCQEHLAPA